MDTKRKTFWKTAVCEIAPHRWALRGYDITKLMGRISYGTLVYLMLKGEMPQPKLGRLMDAILISMADFGPWCPSVAAARYAASGGVDLPAAICAGLLSVGNAHGGTISGAMEVFYRGVARSRQDGLTLEKVAQETVQDFKSRKAFIPGYGRPSELGETDPNGVVIARLDELAKRVGAWGDYVRLSKAIESSLGRTGLNLDGASGAILCEMGFEPTVARAVFCISRIVGLAAEAHEELIREKPFRQTPYSDVTYDGPVKEMPPEFKEEI